MESKTPEIGEACARLLMADSRMIAILDSYTNGRLILSALHNRFDCKYPNHDEARRDLINALSHSGPNAKGEPDAHSP